MIELSKELHGDKEKEILNYISDVRLINIFDNIKVKLYNVLNLKYLKFKSK
ncbi:hypothetical protein LCGC14_1010400 [marine sediment metagenome]|uniref:Uncharacterized protein n=1 Tax=marine sediment metagenome TaxID=412755 RepID=A0A0F9NLU0_9ZZZZ